MGRIWLTLLGLLATLIIAWFCANSHSGQIESDLRERTTTALLADGIDFASVDLDGRDVLIRGTAPDEVKKTQAGEIAAAVFGVFQVDNQLTVTVQTQPGGEPEPTPERDSVEEPASTVPIPPPSQTESAARSCQSEFNAALQGDSIQFATASANIAASSHALLDRLAEIAATCPQATIEVAGHTDSRGAEDMNLTLSQQRAESVVIYLIQAGMAEGRLRASGFGEAQPIGDNETADGRETNRRIEFNVQGI